MSRTNRRTDREQYTRSKAATARLLTLVKPAETFSTRLTEHKRATRNGDVNNHITEHHFQKKHQFDWDSATCITYSTNYYQRLTLESWFTKLEQTPLNRSQQLPAPYKLLIDEIKQNYERTTGELTIWLTIDDCLTLTIDGSKRTNYWLRVFIVNSITA